MRANKGECARISHSEGDEKTPNFLRLTEKRGKRQKQTERRWRATKERVRISISEGLKKNFLELMEIGTGRWKKRRVEGDGGCTNGLKPLPVTGAGETKEKGKILRVEGRGREKRVRELLRERQEGC